MKPSPTTPIPARADSSTLAKHFQPGEPAVIVKLMGVGNTAPFEFHDSKGARTFVMRWDARAGGHQIRVPLSIWQANNAKIAHDFMDQRRMSHAVVVTFEMPDAAKLAESLPTPASTTSEAQFTLDCIKATLQSYAGQDVTQENLQECLDRIANAVSGTIEAPATISLTEKGATDTTSNALNVVGPGLAEPTVAPASDDPFMLPAEGTVYEIAVDAPAVEAPPSDAIPAVATAPTLDELAYDLVEQPKRIKALAALMGVDEAILRKAITCPASKVELVNPGWVRRKEA